MRLFVNAVITGIGLKLGADLYRLVKKKLGLPDDGDKAEVLDPAQQS